jgi:hypothetical protein
LNQCEAAQAPAEQANADLLFDIRNDDDTDDFEGAELADDQAAHAYSVRACRSLAAETVRGGHFTVDHLIEIRNEQREVIGTVRFDEAVEIRS